MEKKGQEPQGPVCGKRVKKTGTPKKTRKRKRKLKIRERIPMLFLTAGLVFISAAISCAVVSFNLHNSPVSVDEEQDFAAKNGDGSEGEGPAVSGSVPRTAKSIRPDPALKPGSAEERIIVQTVPVYPEAPAVSRLPPLPLSPPEAPIAYPPLPGRAGVKTDPGRLNTSEKNPAVEKTSPVQAAGIAASVADRTSGPESLAFTPMPVDLRLENRPEHPEPVHQGTLIFVIDDAGNNLRELEPFLRFPGPLTIAVLPGLPYSAEAARRIRAAGKEVFLHQPMEAVGGKDPGPGAVFAGMKREEIRSIISRNLDELGPVAGMNNHQGSMVTMDIKMMETVLSLCKERGIIFLDSKTIAESAAPAAARRIGIKIGERDVFLDNIQEKAAMIEYVHEGLQKAGLKGSAVMIGHTWSAELAATLEELYPELIARGYSLSTISRFIMGIDDDEYTGY